MSLARGGGDEPGSCLKMCMEVLWEPRGILRSVDITEDVM